MFEVYLAPAILLAALALFGLWVALSHLRFAAYHRDRESAPPPLGLVGTFAVLLAVGPGNRHRSPGGPRAPLAATVSSPRLAKIPDRRCSASTASSATALACGASGEALGRRGRSTLAVSMGRPWRPIESNTPRHWKRPCASWWHRSPAKAYRCRRPLDGRPGAAPWCWPSTRISPPRSGASSLSARPTEGPPWCAVWPWRPSTGSSSPAPPFSTELPDFRTCAPDAEVTTVAAERDFIVYPKSTSHLAGRPHGRPSPTRTTRAC